MTAVEHLRCLEMARADYSQLPAAQRLLPTMRQVTSDFVVQRYIPGDDRQIYSFHAYYNGDSEPLVRFVGRKIRSYPNDSGLSTYLELVKDARVASAGMDVLRKLSFVGPVKLDFKEDPRDGRLYLLEVNARCTLWNYLGAVNGVSIPRAAWADLNGERVEPQDEYGVKVRWLSLGNDFRSFIRCYHRNEGLTWTQYLRSLARPKVYDVFAWKDPIQALDLAAARLTAIREESGPAAIFHYRSGGSLGMMKSLCDLFFERFGPVTVKRGDICSGAGDEAQTVDFGVNDSHDLFDLRNSRNILLWGKNVFTSSPHTIPVLNEARKRGASLVLVDPGHHDRLHLRRVRSAAAPRRFPPSDGGRADPLRGGMDRPWGVRVLRQLRPVPIAGFPPDVADWCAACRTGNPRFAWDSYRRFLEQFGRSVFGHDPQVYSTIVGQYREREGVEDESALDFHSLREIAEQFERNFSRKNGRRFPENVNHQLLLATEAVIGSWMSPRAEQYRSMHLVKGAQGTAVTVQAMVFGNMGANSGAGVAFSRNPWTGEPGLLVDFKFGSQGEDVVSGDKGVATQLEIQERLPVEYQSLADIAGSLERRFREMQDIEFTIQDGRLWMLQTRNGKRTGVPAIRVAAEIHSEGLITTDEALLLVDPCPCKRDSNILLAKSVQRMPL